MRDTQLEQIRELGCEILDQLAEVCDPIFALHPLSVTPAHVAALRQDAAYSSPDLEGRQLDWIGVAGVLGALTDDSSERWAVWGSQPREWCSKLWLKTYHIEELADCYDCGRAGGFRNDEASTVRLRIRFEELHRFGVPLFQAIDEYEANRALTSAGARDTDIADRAIERFLSDPYAVFWDRRDRSWFTWLDFGREIFNLTYGCKLSPEQRALLGEMGTELGASTAPGTRIETLELPPLEALPNFDEVLRGEPLLAAAKRFSKEFRVVGETKKALRVYAKGACLVSGSGGPLTLAEIKAYVVGRALCEAIECCTIPQRIRRGSHVPFEEGGALLSPYDHFRSDPEAFAAWLKTRTLAGAAEILRAEGATPDSAIEQATPQDKIDAINIEQEFSGDDEDEDARADIALDGLTVLMGFATEGERGFLRAAHRELLFAGGNLTQDELAKRLDRTPASVRQIFSRLRGRHRGEIASVWQVSKERVPRSDIKPKPPKAPAPAKVECVSCRAYLKRNAGAVILLCAKCGKGSNPELSHSEAVLT